jgi:hypothetical protein
MGTPWGPMGPMGTHGFSMIFRGGRGSGRQKMWGGVGGWEPPPHESLGRAESLVKFSNE